MSMGIDKPSVAFVWPLRDMKSSVIDMCRRTYSRIICDLTLEDLDKAAAALIRADIDGDVADVKLSSSQLLSDGLRDFLGETGAKGVWVELNPYLDKASPAEVLESAAALAPEYVCHIVTGHLILIKELLAHYPMLHHLALKGSEASGFVSTENLLPLLAAVKKMAADSSAHPTISVWGGIGSARAAAALLSVGVRGIVFESLHWLTDLINLDPEMRDKIAKLRPEHTELIGLNLGAPCRVFNKGNSVAVKKLREYTGSLCQDDITDEQRRVFAAKVSEEAILPLASHFSREELIPLGIEACFAQSFVEKYGADTEDAVAKFIRDIDEGLAKAKERERAFVEGPILAQMGTRYAIVQGAMSWITDVPDFALRVAEAGALPTIALGLMPASVLNEKLGGLKTLLADKPFAVNVITLQENPFRDEQLEWICQIKPRFAVIAAGEPSHAKQLFDAGIEVIYIAPNLQLLELAFSSGIRFVICEGNEAGGHVGEHSTFTLAQIVMEKKEKEPGLFEGRFVILAGGISSRESAFVAAMLGADAIQIGTLYLTTSDIVETGALSKLYQQMILESEPGATVITGEATGLRVRSLKTPKIEHVCDLERGFAAGATDEQTFRRLIEEASAGSLFVAARCMDRATGAVLDEETCKREGQFMSGACAGVLSKIRTCKELHEELAEGALPEGLPYTGPLVEPIKDKEPVYFSESAPPQRVAPCRVSGDKERIAITGMSIVNSLGNSPQEVWAASMALKSGIIEVPASKWPHEKFFDPRPRAPEKTYCKVGAFQNIEVDRKELGIPPQDFRTMTASTRITMWLAQQAIQDSGILEADIPRERIAVLISQNSGEAAATLEDMIVRSAASRIVDSIRNVITVSDDTAHTIEEAIRDGRLAVDDTTLLGRLNCTAGGFICNKYGFMGPSFAVSAACATALVALFSAYEMIRNGVIDAAVIGGAEEPLTPMHFLEFSALGALAGLSGVERPPAEYSRPFDAARDGMVLGEGGGMIVIERESVARQRGARIHAYITAMGASNNHLGMVESSRITQEIAIRASFDDAPYGPEGVDLVECHATSTMQGDGEEVLALRNFFGPDAPVVLTSFKSQIGHTLGASGVNSLIRGVMALKAGAYPPTLNYRNPDPAMLLEGSGMTILTEPAEWAPRNGKPRRFQVNAFGFGGSNYVVQIEEAWDDRGYVIPDVPSRQTAAAKRKLDAPLPSGVQFFTTEIRGQKHRLAVLADTPQDAHAIISGLEPLKQSLPLSDKDQRALAKQGVYLGPADATPKPLAFIFPGQGSHYAGMGLELYETFPLVREWMDKIASAADFDILNLMFYDTEEDLQKTRWQQPALFTMELSLVKYLMALGVHPVALAGHSLGELTALCVAGVYSYEDGFRIVNKRAICMDKACEMNIDPGVMMACDAPLEYLEEIIAQRENIYITNINSPHQVVIGGNTEAVKQLGEELKAQGYRRTLLRVSMAFHSPIMRCIHDELDAFVSGIQFHPPQIPVVSNTTMKPFPSDANEIRAIIMAHLESPVHWMQNATSLWNDFGVRTFIEVGPRDILTNLVLDTLPEADCIYTCQPSSEVSVFRGAMAQIYVRGLLPFEGDFAPFPGEPHRAAPRASAKPIGVAPVRAPHATLPASVSPSIFSVIESFVQEGFQKFFKPSLLYAIRRDYDPNFAEADLEQALAAMFPILASGQPLKPLPAPPSAGLRESTAPSAEKSAPAAEAKDEPRADDLTEAVIGLIMEATGYERSEIEPSMDLREDLSIRSSRLPVIMDSMENKFGIKIHLEDFMEVRTIADIVEKLRELVDPKWTTGAGVQPAAAQPAEVIPEEEIEAPVELEPLRRVVFVQTEIEAQPSSEEVSFAQDDAVAVLTLDKSDRLASGIAAVLQNQYHVKPVIIDLSLGSSLPVSDETPTSWAPLHEKLHATLSSIDHLAGMVVSLSGLAKACGENLGTASPLLSLLFTASKSFLNSSARKCACCAYEQEPEAPATAIMAQGVAGMFLSLGHEFSSVQFRVVGIERGRDLSQVLRDAFNRGQKVVETFYRQGALFTTGGVVENLRIPEDAAFGLTPDDVIVLSGGARGITYHLAEKLADFGCKLVFLGTTRINPDVNYKGLLSEGFPSPTRIDEEIRKRMPGVSEQGLVVERAAVVKALEIVANVEKLRARKVETSYYRCDVADKAQTAQICAEILRRYEKIDGVIHGAGVLRDNFVKQMSWEDFLAVTDVKFRGAWNLYQAFHGKGLRLFVCLSSAAAIQGNPGQANYSTANRMMSTLASELQSQDRHVRFKSLHLPPIQGAGMAENDDIKALMKRMGASYVHVDELAELFIREVIYAPQEKPWVLFMRSLPQLESSRLDMSEPPVPAEELVVEGMAVEKARFPMIDDVRRVELQEGVLIASRTFSHGTDPWIADHKPFKFLKHPLVSAIMAVETFLEVARALYPYLKVQAVRDAQFLDILECAPHLERETEIRCRRVSSDQGEVVCEVVLAARSISPKGEKMNDFVVNYKAHIVLSALDAPLDMDLLGFPVPDHEIETRPMFNEEVMKLYDERSDLKGRYRIIREMQGSGPDCAKGQIVYPAHDDFAPPRKSAYQYSPYLLEALMQAAMLYVGMRDEKDKRVMIPHRIGEIVFARQCKEGEVITIEGRMRRMDKQGMRWEARGLDSGGAPIMCLRKMEFRWFSG